MSNEKKCVAGCKMYEGGEIRHHKDCVFYPESFSEMYADLQKRIKELEDEIENESTKPDFLVDDVMTCKKVLNDIDTKMLLAISNAVDKIEVERIRAQAHTIRSTIILVNKYFK
jgi:hypothetical protein